MAQHSTDLVIIGGGILGASHALHALERGLSVRLLEKDLRPMSASVRNFGQVVPSGMDSEWQAYGRKSLEMYKGLQKKVDLGIEAHGSLYIASDAEEMCLLEELSVINQGNDYPSELLDATQCVKQFPGVRDSYCKGALFFPEEITIDARRMIHLLLAYLVEQKGLLYHAPNSALEISSSSSICKVRDNHGNLYEADQIILCGGHEFKLLYPQLFAESDLEVTKLQMMQTIPQPHLRIKGNILTGLSIRRYESFQDCPSYADIHAQEDSEALWKKWGVHILLKQNPDGSCIIGDSHHYADASKADDLGFDLLPEVNAYMIAEARKMFNLEDWTLQRQWYGIYSQCKTGSIFQRTIDDAVHIVTGIGGKGMTASLGFAQKHIEQLYT